MRFIKNLAALSAVFGLFMLASTAQASTPANTALENTATLTFDGGTASASVTVTVDLVPTAAALFGAAPAIAVDKSENTAYSASFTIKAQGNGLDTYTIITSYTAPPTVASGTFTAAPTVSVGSIALGATAANASALVAATSITVPADGASDAAINGLAVGDTFVVAGNSTEYLISSITDNATGTSTINFGPALVDAVSTGDGLFEIGTFTSDVADVGEVDGGADELIVIVEIQVATNAALEVEHTTTITVSAVTILKYVRNIDRDCLTTGATCTGLLSYDSGSGANDYHSGGIIARPTETLEYLLVVTTTAVGATNAALTDVLDEYTTYVTGSTRLNAIAVSDGAGIITDPTFTLNPTDTTVPIGLLIDDDAGRTGGTQGTGTVASSQVVRVVYRVTVDASL